MALRRESVILGPARLNSHPFSNIWFLHGPSGEIARMRRVPSRHYSHGLLDERPVDIEPEGWGTMVIAEEHGPELGRIVRRSWWGRHWEISGRGFQAELVSERLPRKWTFRIGGQPIARMAGSVLSYNRLRIEADLSIPAWAMLLAWQVAARPWEAAAAPRSLRSVPAQQDDQ